MPPRQKRSPDPLQEQLRQHKKEWNAATREFISHLIAFKDGMNGRGNAEAGLPPSNIKDPLPGEIGSFLSALSSEFQALTSGAGSIVGEQTSYSKNRRKGKPKGQKNPGPQNQPTAEPTPSNQADQILSRLSNNQFRENILTKYGSNRRSRAWEYLKSFLPSRKELNKQRIGLLSASADLFFSILDFENDALTLDIDNTPALISKFKYLKYNLEALGRSAIQIAEHIKKNDNSAPEGGEPNSPLPDQEDEKIPSELVDRMDQNVLNIERKLDNIRRSPEFSRFGEDYTNQVNKCVGLVQDFKKEEDPTFKEEYKKLIFKEVKKLLTIPKYVIEKPTNSVFDANAVITYTQIIKEAHNPISRFLKRKLVNALKFNKTAIHRLRIVEEVDGIKKLLQKMMDTLEGTNLNFEVLNNLIQDMKQVAASLEGIKQPLSILNLMYRERFYEDEKKRLQPRNKGQGHHNQHDPMMDWVLRKKVRRELADDLDQF